MMGFGYHVDEYDQLRTNSQQNVEGMVAGLLWN